MNKLIKAMITTTLTLSMILGSTVFTQAAENPYLDVNESDWYYDSVMYAKEVGYMTGVNTNHFDPGACLQRQDFALLLMRHYMSKGQTVTEPDDGTYYGKAVAWAKNHNIMTGYDSGEFGVGDFITRQDCAVALNRYMEIWGITYLSPTEMPNYREKEAELKATYADVELIGSHAFRVMFRAVMIDGLIKGTEKDGVKYLEPTEYTTRGTISVMTQRWFEEFDEMINQQAAARSKNQGYISEQRG